MNQIFWVFKLMTFTRIFFFALSIIVILLPAEAQQIKQEIVEGDFQVEGGTLVGHTSIIPHPGSKVERSLFYYLKTVGRTSSEEGYFVTKEISSLGAEHSSLEIISKLTALGDSTRLSMGMDTTGLSGENFDKLSPQMRVLMEEFHRKIFVEMLQEEIDEAQKAAVIQSKKHQKLVSELRGFERKLELNALEKEKLETSAQRNAEEKIEWEEKIELNKNLQILADEDLRKINKRVEQLKSKLTSPSQ